MLQIISISVTNASIMRTFHQLDLNALKAFYFAAKELHFTRAAEHAGLTQSGVSQHIKTLEETLGTPLFIRQAKKVLLTDSGIELQKFAESYLDSVEGLFERLNQQGADLKGDVRYAMPESCLFTPHYPLLLDARSKEFPGIKLEVRICDSEKVAELVLNGEIDFGFLTRELANRNLSLEKFAEEEYVLASASAADLNFSNARELLERRIVHYPGENDLFDFWFAGEFPKAHPITIDQLESGSKVDHLRAAITMVEKGLGIGVFPRHCIDEQIRAKKLKVRSAKGEAGNPIYIAQLKDATQPARVRKVVDTFWEMKGKRR